MKLAAIAAAGQDGVQIPLTDYRPPLLRGLYWTFFTRFKEDHYGKAMQASQKAAALNPKSPLPQFFIGWITTKKSFWTKAAWASDQQRDDIVRKAIPAYTAAIQLDSKFLPAYEERASAYLQLKQYEQAIRDYDRILELDPKTSPPMPTGDWLSSTADFPRWVQSST